MGAAFAALGNTVGAFRSTAGAGTGTGAGAGGGTICAGGTADTRGGAGVGAGGATEAGGAGGATGADCARDTGGAVGADAAAGAKFGGAPGSTRRDSLGTVDVVVPHSFIETGSGVAGTMTGARRTLAGLGAVDARRKVAGTGTVGSGRAIEGLGKTGALGRGGFGAAAAGVTLPGGHDAVRTPSRTGSVAACAPRVRDSGSRLINQ